MAFDNKQITRRFIEEVWNTGDFSKFDEFVAPNYEGHDPVLGTYDREGLKKTIESYRTAFPDLKVELVTLVADDRYVVTRWVARGTHRGAFLGMEPTGKSTVTSGIDLGELKDGKLVSDINEYDSLALLRQLGAAEKFIAEPPRTTAAPVEQRH